MTVYEPYVISNQIAEPLWAELHADLTDQVQRSQLVKDKSIKPLLLKCFQYH